MIYKREIGKCEGVRLIEQTGIPHGNDVSGSYISPFSFASWVNRYSDWAFFFGADTVAEAIVVLEEIRAKIPTDFGRSKGIAVYHLGAARSCAVVGGGVTPPASETAKKPPRARSLPAGRRLVVQAWRDH